MSDNKLEKLRNRQIVTIQNKEYQLRKVTEEELFQRRLECKPGIVYKKGDELYYAEMTDANATLARERNWLQHLCSSESECCERLSAAPDPQGCRLIRNRSFANYKKYKTSRGLEYLCKVSMRIEKYSYVTEGLETFGGERDSLKVLSCTHCSKNMAKPKKVDPDERNKSLLFLARNIYPEVDSLEKLKKKLYDDIS